VAWAAAVEMELAVVRAVAARAAGTVGAVRVVARVEVEMVVVMGVEVLAAVETAVEAGSQNQGLAAVEVVAKGEGGWEVVMVAVEMAAVVSVVAREAEEMAEAKGAAMEVVGWGAEARGLESRYPHHT